MRKLALFCGAFAAAVFAAVGLLPAHWLLPARGMCAALFLLVIGIRWVLARRAGGRTPPPQTGRIGHALRGVGIAAAALALGLLWYHVYSLLFFTPALEMDGKIAPVTAVVLEHPEATDYGSSLRVRVVRSGGPDIPALLFADETGFSLRPGDTVTLNAICRRADVTTRGEEISYYRARGVYLALTLKGSFHTVTTPDGHLPLDCYPALLQRHFRDAVARVFPADAAPLAVAIVTGNDSLLDDTLTTAMGRTGTAHVVAVSGMHISFLMGLLMLLFGRNRRRTALLGLPLLLLFAVAAGATPSVVRAVVMNAVLLLAPLVGRERDTPTSLALALFLLLAQNPYAAQHIGLQLSFAAVAGMLALSHPLQTALTARFLPKKSKGMAGWRAPLRKVWTGAARLLISAFAASVGAIAFTAPLSALYFRQVSLIAPLANLLSLWAVSLVFVGGLLAGLAGLLLLPAGQVIALCTAPAARYVAWIARTLSRIPFAAITMASVYYRSWVAFVYLLLLTVLLLRPRTRPLFPLCCAVMGLCAALLLTHLTGTAGDLTLSVLDVGQGQSIVLHSGGRVLVLDCGGNASRSAGDIAADYLQDLGLQTVDLLVLTHYHADHANGVPALMERLDIAALALPDTAPGDGLRNRVETLASAEGAPIHYITERTTVTLGETTVTLYPPMGDGGMNEEGLSLLATSGTFDVLVTGDMPYLVEARLVERGDLPDIEVLVAGHHGSKYSSSTALLEATLPETAIISVGRNNYGHPTDEAMGRLADIGAVIYRTDLSGTVTVRANN